MNILIVDDDLYIIQALKEKIHWTEIGTTNLFTAYNMAQAQEIIKTKPIHILISDIEMPKGSGLELLSWIRNEGFNIQAIFLTNYADFNYAQKAIELQSFDYYLKPIDFDRFEWTIKKLIQTTMVNQKQSNIYPDLEEQLWYNILRKPSEKSQDQLLDYVKHNRLTSLPEKHSLIPLVITLKLTKDQSDDKNYSWLNVIKNNINVLLSQHHLGILVSSFKLHSHHEKYFLLLQTEISSFNQETALLIQQYIEQKLTIPTQLVFGNRSDFHSIITNTSNLFDFIHTTIGHSTGIYSVNQSLIADGFYDELIDLKSIEAINPEKLTVSLLTQLLNFNQYKVMRSTSLRQIQIDIFQKVFIHLSNKNVVAHLLFSNDLHDFFEQRSKNSIESWLDYIIYYVKTANDYITLLDSKHSVSHIVKEYIHTHFSSNLSRQVLADLVYISPDHLARLFKQETGINLVSYITETRIKEAKKLLTNSDLTVYLIAEEVGYDNYSYFSKVFKKETGLTPIEFRNNQLNN